MNIEFRRKPDKEEMMVAYDFFKKNMNKIIGTLIVIAALIVGYNLYRSSYESNKVLAAEKMYEISKAYQTYDNDTVISKGEEYIDKFSGYDSTGDIVIFVARAYIRKDNTDQAISILEKNMNTSKNSTFKFSVFNILGGLYMDKWIMEKNPALAEKAGEYYLKAAYSDRGLQKDRTLYNAGNSFVQAGKTDKAKDTLKPLYENSAELEYQLREKVKYLYENID
ncbi:MAG: tetratricopeptide repeat protein [Candidatus Delongbacteria bacterium]|nr:tetratricopeptide repeat protein [Candidatus Delongbacteria bacterium]